MAHVHVPHVEEKGSKWLLKVGLEVVLITVGVFLALVGEGWQESARTNELVETSLARLRTEIQNNRAALAGRVGYHTELYTNLSAYLKTPGPKTPATFTVPTPYGAVGPVFMEASAWDLATSTQSLAHIEPELAFALARAYSLQETYQGLQSAIVQSTIYGKSMTQDFEGYWWSVHDFLGDIQFFDGALIKSFDEVLPQIESALAD